MAESVVSFLVETLGDLLISEAKFLHGVSNQIVEIQRELRRMQCFLKDADARQGESNSVRNWVDEIRELAYKTEDLIEIYVVEVSSKKGRRFKEILRRLACIVREGMTLHKVGSEIQNIKAELTSLTSSLQTYGIRALDAGESSSSAIARQKGYRTSYSHLIEKDFVGMEKEIKRLISHLKSKDKGFEVISVWGMGGIGKTTLATKIYHLTEIRAHFQAFAWVCITQQLQREQVLKSILKQLLPGRKEEISTMEDGELVGELHKVQQEKACLVVVDDIWKLVDWKRLTAAFPIGSDSTGSKILLTTRTGKVAEVGLSYKLEALSEDEGWQLLVKKAFPKKADNDPEEKVNLDMEKIGKNMVRRCQGLPLAISTLGGILKGKMLKDWEKINKDIASYLSKGGDDEYGTVTQVLALSYDNLPPHLKYCFLYFGNFKEDEVIQGEKLYELWMAEGIVSSDKRVEGEMTMDVAERYLGDLEQRSLVQIEPMDEGLSWLKFPKCRVHDLVRDLCLSKGKEEKFFNVIDFKHDHHQVVNSISTATGMRRLGIHFDDDTYSSILDAFAQQNVIRQVRSLLLFETKYTTRKWPEETLSLQKFKMLQVLMLIRFDLDSAKWLGKLVYLKHLSLKDCKLEMLPSSIGNLRNLRTLDLRVRCEISIPNVLWKLKLLNHLYLPYAIRETKEVVKKKLRFDGLSELEMLRNFKNESCDANDLLKLRKVKVFSVRIRYSKNVWLDVLKIINFITSQRMRYSSIDIKGVASFSEGDEIESYPLIKILECPFLNRVAIDSHVGRLPNKDLDHHLFSQSQITIISLWSCEFEEDPMTLLEKLPNLRHLRLNGGSYLGEEMVCSATGFPQLRYLLLDDLRNLARWMVEQGAMPNLSILYVDGCRQLEMLPDGLRFLRSLRELYIWRMPTNFTNRVQVKDGVEGEDYHKVSKSTLFCL